MQIRMTGKFTLTEREDIQQRNKGNQDVERLLEVIGVLEEKVVSLQNEVDACDPCQS
jgi:hypothetical protein